MMVRWLRAFGALVTLLALVVGVPLLLVRVAGWPLPTKVPDWDHVSRMVRQGEIQSDPVIKTLAVLVWFAWVQVAWALLWELIVNVPGQAAGRRVASSAPLVATPVSNTVGRLVAAILAVGLFTASPAAAHAPLLSLTGHGPAPIELVDVAHGGQSSPRPLSRTGQSPVAAAAEAESRWVANETDTLWDVAETVLGDGSRVGELLELNPHIRSARQLRPGQVILVPAGTSIPESRQPAATPETEPVIDETPATTIFVEEDDNLWDLAEEHLRSVGADTSPPAVADYINEIVTANPDTIHNPNLIFPNQQLVFPEINTPNPPAPPPAPDPLPAAPLTEGRMHTVVEGETLSGILAAAYGYVDADLIWTVAEPNGLEDPNLILVGQQLFLPATLTAVPVTPFPPPLIDTAVPSVTVPPAAPVAVPEPAADVPVSTLPAVASAPPAATVAPSTTVPPATSPAAPAPATTVTPTSPPPVTVAAADDVDEVDDGADADGLELFDWSVRTLWWQVPMGLLLASGLVAMMRRFRYRRLGRLEPGEQLAEPPDVAAGTELAATVAAPAARLATLQALLRTVTPHAREQDDPPPVRAVEFDDDRVTILFKSPAPFPPPGWTTVDGGRSWEHRMTEGVTAPVRQLVTPALVTVGHRTGGGEVLLDVESAGSVALVGDRNASLGVARSMTLELATYPLGVPMDVCPIGFHVDGLDDCDRGWPNTTLTRAVRVARQMLDRTAATGAVSLLAARAALDYDDSALDPQLFVVDVEAVADSEQALLDELVTVCQPQSGAAVILIGGHRDAHEVIEIDSSTSATWSGVQLRPPVVDREAAAQVAVMFDHIVHAPAEPLSVSPVVADLLAAAANPAIGDPVWLDEPGNPQTDHNSTDADADVVEYRYQPPDHDVLVQILGEVTVHGRDVGSAGAVELLTVLTCFRARQPNIDSITGYLTPLEPESTLAKPRAVTADPRPPMQKRISHLRKALGHDIHGDELLPHAPGGRGSQGRYRVSPRVLTDLELIDHRLQTSLELASGDALQVLRDGLALFVGPAFVARKGYEWAAPVSARVVNVVSAYTTRLMALAFDADDLALVLEATRCAGQVIDDPVAEIPMRQLMTRYAEASGDPNLVAAVADAHRRLTAHVYTNDALATDA